MCHPNRQTALSYEFSFCPSLSRTLAAGHEHTHGGAGGGDGGHGHSHTHSHEAHSQKQHNDDQTIDDVGHFGHAHDTHHHQLLAESSSTEQNLRALPQLVTELAGALLAQSRQPVDG